MKKNCVVCGFTFHAKGRDLTCSKECSKKRERKQQLEYRQCPNRREQWNEYMRNYRKRHKP